MIHRLILSTVAAIPATLFAGSFGPLLRSEDATFPENCCAIHLIHAKGGEFIMFGRQEQGTLGSWTFNAFTGDFSETIDIGENVFCCGVSQLPDGKPIIVGGDMGSANGATETYVFDLADDEWIQKGDLSESRWYPTPAILSDGTLTAISGWGDRVPSIEWRKNIDIFNASNGTWADFEPTFDLPNNGYFQPHFYPFMIPYYDPLAPTTRKLFFAGRSTVNGIGISHTFQSFSLAFASNSAAVWKPLGGDSDMEGSGAVIMIEGTDPIDVGTVYKFGGRRNGVIVGTGAKINLNDGSVAEWDPVADMPAAQNRTECNVVAMADGRIAVVGGTYSTVIHSLYSTGRNNILIYNPATDTYDEISGSFSGTRMYHSTSVYSPTATIFMAGGQYLNDVDGPEVSNFTAQEYYPSYFDDETVRPLITASPTSAYWNTTIQVTATGPVDHFSLLKLSSTTHANDTTQRYIKLTEASRTGNNYQLKMPKNGGIAPPGYYMLFAVSTSGVPSVARYVQIAENPE